MALQGGVLRIQGADSAQYAAIQSWGKTRWDRKNHELRGWADLELLDKLAGLVRLPPRH